MSFRFEQLKTETVFALKSSKGKMKKPSSVISSGNGKGKREQLMLTSRFLSDSQFLSTLKNRIHEESLALYPSTTIFPDPTRISFIARFLLRLAEIVHLVKIYRDENGRISECSNLTLLNAILVMRGVERDNSNSLTKGTSSGSIADSNASSIIASSNGSTEVSQKKEIEVTPTKDRNFCINQPKGPKITEHSLWLHVMTIQVLGSMFAFGVRYWIAAIVFPNR